MEVLTTDLNRMLTNWYTLNNSVKTANVMAKAQEDTNNPMQNPYLKVCSGANMKHGVGIVVMMIHPNWRAYTTIYFERGKLNTSKKILLKSNSTGEIVREIKIEI
jgi:hypothetical protein